MDCKQHDHIQAHYCTWVMGSVLGSAAHGSRAVFWAVPLTGRRQNSRALPHADHLPTYFQHHGNHDQAHTGGFTPPHITRIITTYGSITTRDCGNHCRPLPHVDCGKHHLAQSALIFTARGLWEASPCCSFISADL